MKNLLGILSVVLFMATSAAAQQNSRTNTSNRETRLPGGNVGTDITSGQGNTANTNAANAADKGATSTARPNSSVPNSNGTNAAAGTGNTLDQNAGSATSGTGGTSATKTDNTSSIIKGHAPDVKPKKIKPRE